MVAQAFAVSAFAQGEVGAVKKPAPVTKATPEEKAAGKAHRKAEGTAAIKEQPPGEVGAVPATTSKSNMSKEDKAAARAARKSETAAANKAGTLPKSGEVGPTK
ncbi:hypothetical protein ASF43_25890 [Pseudorhodoferax sp. Leaf267]|nr:hypothetical protein ASF43_25890 [Pseudorhodoferax sp. Leaf267]